MQGSDWHPPLVMASPATLESSRARSTWRPCRSPRSPGSVLATRSRPSSPNTSTSTLASGSLQCSAADSADSGAVGWTRRRIHHWTGVEHAHRGRSHARFRAANAQANRTKSSGCARRAVWTTSPSDPWADDRQQGRPNRSAVSGWVRDRSRGRGLSSMSRRPHESGIATGVRRALRGSGPPIPRVGRSRRSPGHRRVGVDRHTNAAIARSTFLQAARVSAASEQGVEHLPWRSDNSAAMTGRIPNRGSSLG